MNSSRILLHLSTIARLCGAVRIASPACALMITAFVGCETSVSGDPDYQPGAGGPLVTPDAGATTAGGTTAGSFPPVASSTANSPAGGATGSTGTTGSSASGVTSSGTAGGGTTAGSVGRVGSGGLADAGATTSGLGGILNGFGLGGLSGLGGSTSGTGSAASAMPLDPSVKQPDASKLPKVKGTCPDLSRDGRVTINGSSAQVWVGSKPGPVYFYWHGTGSSPDEVDQGLPAAAAGTKSNGGIVASWETSNEQGESTGNFWSVWFTGDFDAADQILACGIEKGIVDTGRIHTAGYSAGGLQAGAMLFARSNYLASGIVYSGGKGFGASKLQDPSNAPALLGAHGAQGSDTLVLDFHDWTMDLEKELKGLGAFAMDCDDNGSHIDFALGARAGVGGKAMQFLKDHPYNTKPSPYASALPTGFPNYCKIVQ